jgi:hypothetical protein
MAKLVNPLLSGAARGKANGQVYNTWRGIAYCKKFTSPAQPRTTLQLAARALLSSYVASWKTITQAQRDAWDVYAADHLQTDWTGTPLRLTGQNWYISCNVNASRMGGSAITSPPTTAAPTAPTGIVITKATADMKVAWTTPSTGTTKLEFRLQGPHSAGAKGRYPKSKFKVAWIATTTIPAMLYASAPVGVYTCWYRVSDPVTGLVSLWQSIDFTMT